MGYINEIVIPAAQQDFGAIADFRQFPEYRAVNVVVPAENHVAGQSNLPTPGEPTDRERRGFDSVLRVHIYGDDVEIEIDFGDADASGRWKRRDELSDS